MSIGKKMEIDQGSPSKHYSKTAHALTMKSGLGKKVSLAENVHSVELVLW